MNRKHLVLIGLMALIALVIPSLTAGVFLLGVAIGAFLAIQLND